MKQGISLFRKAVAGVLLVTGLSVAPLHATEVYTWTDEDGIVHFSDSPPENGEPRTITVEGAYKPGTTGAYPVPAASAETEATAAADAESTEEPPLTAAQQRREDMARGRQERQEAQQEIDRMCGLHRQRLAQMEPARRVFYTNEAGEQVRMDDDERMGMIEESRSFVEKNCD